MMSTEQSKAARRSGRPGDHRCTPEEVWSVCLEAVGVSRFCVDPCSNEFATVPAVEKFFDEGLEYSWRGTYVWVNPPFSNIRPWVDKVIEESPGKAIQLLGPASTETSWWRKAATHCTSWCAWKRRVHFPLEDSGEVENPTGSFHVFYFGSGVKRWRRVMSMYGNMVFWPADDTPSQAK